MALGRSISLPQIPTEATFTGGEVEVPQLVLGNYIISNVSLAAGENAIVITSTTKYFRITAKNNSILTVTTTSGGAQFLQIVPGESLEPPGTLDLSANLTLYITATKPSTDLAVETWT